MSFTIKMARAKLDASQEQMAQHLGVSRVTYRGWENGTVKIPGFYLQRLAELTGINEHDFYLPEPTNKNSKGGKEVSA